MKARDKMPIQKKSFQLPLIGTILLFLLAGLYLFASKRFSKSDSSNPVTKHKVDTSSEETLKYWTVDKMRNAKPADLPTTDKIERKKQHKADSQQS
jgi:hypothetical protein